jgi:hypothetical protein
MGWHATGDPWTGGPPDQEPGLPPPPRTPAEFDHGGPWASVTPSAALAAALEQVAGPGDLYDGAGTDALVGIARQWAAVESWAASGKLAALRAMTREDADGSPRLRRRPDLPDGWDDSLTYEVSGALAMGPVSAGNLACLAWALGTRLAGIGRLLAGGVLTLPKARLIAATFEPLDEQEAARAEALILDELAGKTYPQVERLAWRAALAVAPDVAERRRQAGERQARVTVFREESGAVGLSGRDLPAAEALAAHANVIARAGQYHSSGVFGSQSSSRLEAIAYTDLLNGVSAMERIEFTRSAAPEPPAGPEPDDAGSSNSGDGPDGGTDGPGPSGKGGSDGGRGPRPGGDGSAIDPGDGSHPGPSAADGSDGAEVSKGAPGRDEPGNGAAGRQGDPDQPADLAAAAAPLAEVTVPLATLQRRAERAGDNRLLGPLDPALARALAAAAARSPNSRWEIIVVDEHGYATGHGTARPTRGAGSPPQLPPTGPVGCALPARVNITITEAFLHQLEAQVTRAAQPRSGAPPGAWDLTQSKAGAWLLTLPAGQQLAVRFDLVPTYACDHRYQVSSYLPGDRLRRLVQVRDHTCTWPPCSRPARESDFEHAVAYDKGGVTCACNAGARSRRCHQVKQMPGWTVTQPKPGWHVWTTPTGRSYTQEPWRYTALAGLTCGSRGPVGDKEGLGADADGAVEIGEYGGGQPGTARRDRCLGVQADPLALGLPVQVHGELGVDGVPAEEVHLPRGAVPAVGDGKHPFQRTRYLIRHEGVPHATPHRGGAGRGEAASDHAPFDRRQVTVHPAIGQRHGRPVRWRRGRRKPGCHRAGVRAEHAPRGGPCDLAPARARRRLKQLDATAGPRKPDGHGYLTDRDRAKNLAREPGDHHLVPGLEAQHGPAEQGTRRAGVLRARVPGAGRVHRRLPPVVPKRNVEALCHATYVTDRSPEGRTRLGPVAAGPLCGRLPVSADIW